MWVSRQMGAPGLDHPARKVDRWIPSMLPDAGAKAAAAWNLLTAPLPGNLVMDGDGD